MSIEDSHPPRRVKFDPTINLGHVLTAGVFLASAGIAYATVTARLDVNEREITRVERQAGEKVDRIERRFDEDQRRDRESLAEIKVLLRDIDRKLDLKQDKPR